VSDEKAQAMVNAIAGRIDHIGCDINMRRDRPYTGQPWTDGGIRGQTEVKGLTLRDIRDCFIRAYIKSHMSIGENGEPIQPNHALYTEAEKGEKSVLCGNDLYTLVGDIDPMALSQNINCEIEMAMGIFPNVSKGITEGIVEALKGGKDKFNIFGENNEH
jgi:hypothetical protein